MRLIFTVFFTFLHLGTLFAGYENPLPLAISNGAPSAMVNGMVDAITGTYSESEVDMILPGPSPIIVSRSYSSAAGFAGGIGFGWEWSQPTFLKIQTDSKRKDFLLIGESSGASFLYAAKEKVEGVYGVDPNSKESQGLTNSGAGILSGRTNIKNASASYKKGANEVNLVMGDGERRYYRREQSEHPAHLFLIYKEMPDGNRLNYSYLKGGGETIVDAVIATNRNGDQEYGRITLDPYGDWNTHQVTWIDASDGREVKYSCFRDCDKVGGMYKISAPYLGLVERSNAPPIDYRYIRYKNQIDRMLSYRILPDNRYVKNEYYREGKFDVGGKRIKVKEAYRDPRCYRIFRQFQPVGSTKEPIVTATFEYDMVVAKYNQVKSGRTDVYDAYDTKSSYFYNDEHQLTAVKKWRKNGTVLESSENYLWGAKNSKDVTNLLSKSFCNGIGEQVWKESYLYDDRGNVLEKRFKGNLTGEQLELVGVTEQAVDRFTYSNDRFNLPVKHIDPSGVVTSMIYIPNSDLLKAKFTGKEDKIFKREFYFYDRNGTMTKVVKDDGIAVDVRNFSGVTQRSIVYLTPKATAPCIGLPVVIEECALDLKTGQEVRVKKIGREYSREGWVLKESYYDVEDNFSHSTTYSYNNMGQVISETNGLNETTTYSYDFNGNKIQQCGPRPGVVRSFQYDYMNRLIKETIESPWSETATTCHSYDYLGNVVATVNQYGQETRFYYDEFSRLIKTVYFAAKKFSGESYTPTFTKKYDVLGNVIEEIDPKGFSVKKYYNSRSQLILIEHPDGTTERNFYSIDGKLVRTENKNGTVKEKEYDPLGRIVKEKVYGSNGVEEGSVEYTYNHLHLLSVKDPSGAVTRYEYDCAGRKVAEIVECDPYSKVTRFQYDHLGREYRVSQEDGLGHSIAKVKVYDVMNRVIEEREENERGEAVSIVHFQYDEDGNEVLSTSYNENGASTTLQEFDAEKNLLKVVDPTGGETIYLYNHSFINEEGLKVRQDTVIDPLGRQKMETYNVQGMVYLEEILDPFGNRLKEKRFFYDANRLLTETVEKVICGDEVRGEPIITKWSYGPNDRIDLLTEAYGTAEERTTYYFYNEFGEKRKVVKPDGVELRYDYDALSRVSRLYSSDGSVDYRYLYDKKDQPVEIRDALSGAKTVREYNSCGKVVREVLANGRAVRSEFDGMGRKIALQLHDRSKVLYEYDASFLRKVKRMNGYGREIYCHSYLDYDLSKQLIKQKGTVTGSEIDIQYTIKGEISSVSSEHYSQVIPNEGYDAVGNLLEIEMRDPEGEVQGEFSYDALNQLQSERGVEYHDYQFDSLNNRTSADGEEASFNALNQLQADGKGRYRYDLNGNLIEIVREGETVSLSYDAFNRLVAVEKGEDLKATYSYDPFHRRVSKSIAGTPWFWGLWDTTKKTDFIYDDQNEIGEASSNGSFLSFRTLGNTVSAEIGSAVELEVDGELYVPIHDLRGDLVGLLDLDGEVKATYRYTAFGRCQKLEETVESPWRFSSKRVDEETGFVYFGRRYYDPETARWISQDPLGYADGPNRYAYVKNNPMTHYDLYGLFSVRIPTKNDLKRAADFYMGRKVDPYTNQVSYERKTINPITLAIRQHMDALPSQAGVVGNRELSNVRVCFINGINNSLEDCKKSASYISETHGGVNVNYIYNSSHGPVVDLIDSLAEKCGVETRVVRLLRKELRKRIREVGSDGRVIHYAHSEGGLITKRALQGMSPQERSMIEVRTFGSAAHITSDDCEGGAMNYLACTDFANLLDSTNRKQSKKHVKRLFNIREINPIKVHSFLSRTYREKIDSLGKNFVSKNC